MHSEAIHAGLVPAVHEPICLMVLNNMQRMENPNYVINKPARVINKHGIGKEQLL